MLSSGVSGGVRVCCLLSADGSVLCVGGELHAAKLLSALLSSVYQSFSDASTDDCTDTTGGPLLALTALCDAGAVSVARVGRFLVAIQYDGSAMGQVAHKVRRVAACHTLHRSQSARLLPDRLRSVTVIAVRWTLFCLPCSR